jgi:hypothetical protein
LLPGYTADNFKNSLAIGFDIETGGHVFQLMFTNSMGMTENLYVAQTDGDWADGDIHFGFNLTRVFTVGSPWGNRQKPGKGKTSEGEDK